MFVPPPVRVKRLLVSEALSPGLVVRVRLTIPLKLSRLERVMIDELEKLALNCTLFGLAVIEKSCGGTVSGIVRMFGGRVGLVGLVALNVRT